MSAGGSSWWRRAAVAVGAMLPAPVEAAEDVQPGRVQLVGELHCATPLQAPVSGRDCCAFIYTATAVRSGRASTAAPMQRLRRASVYADGLELGLAGGSVSIVPPPSDEFDAAAHEALAEMSLAGFKAKELLLRPGVRVRVLGKASRSSDGGLVVVAEAITKLEAKAEPAPS